MAILDEIADEVYQAEKPTPAVPFSAPKGASVSVLDSVADEVFDGKAPEEKPGFLSRAASAVGSAVTQAIPGAAAAAERLGFKAAGPIVSPDIAETPKDVAIPQIPTPEALKATRSSAALPEPTSVEPAKPVPIRLAPMPQAVREEVAAAPLLERVAGVSPSRQVPPVPEKPAPGGMLGRAAATAGIVDPEAARLRATEQEFAERSVMRKPEGMSEERWAFRQAASEIDRVTRALPQAYVRSMTGGIVPAIYRVFGIETAAAPEGTAAGIASGAGELAGFIAGPAKAAHGLMADNVGKMLAPKAGDAVATIFARNVATQAATLGLASVLAHTGEAATAESLEEAARQTVEHAKGGAMLGAAFGGIQGAIPSNALIGRAARLGVGLTVLDAAQGTHPWDDRATAQQAFDYGLNIFFLWKGQDAVAMQRLLNAEAQARGKGVTPEQVLKSVLDKAQERAAKLGPGEAPTALEAELKTLFAQEVGDVATGTTATELRSAREVAEQKTGGPVEQRMRLVPPVARPTTLTGQPVILGPTGRPMEAAAAPRPEIATQPLKTAAERAMERAGEPSTARPAPVTFQGLQERARGQAPMELWGLTDDIPGYPKGSTVGRATLEGLGYIVPPAQAGAAPEARSPVTAKVIDRPVSGLTFKDYVETAGQKWPITSRDPNFARLRAEFDDLRKGLYEARQGQGGQWAVVNRKTGEEVDHLPTGAKAQLEANRLSSVVTLDKWREAQLPTTFRMEQLPAPKADLSAKPAPEVKVEPGPVAAQKDIEAATVEGPKPSAEPPAEAKEPAPPATGRVIGKRQELRVPAGSRYQVEYQVVEAEDMIPSHNARTFAKDPRYPEGVQNRPYHSDKSEQAKVIRQGQDFEPLFLVSPQPGSGGTPIVAPDSNVVLSGNSRTMSLLRTLGTEAFEKYRKALGEMAPVLGLNPAELGSMKNPVLVRRLVGTDTTPEFYRRFAKETNEGFKQALNTQAQAVSQGQAVKPETMEWIAGSIDALGEQASLRDFLRSGKDREIIRRFIQDGVFTERDLNRYIDPRTTQLNEDGKRLVERAILGNAVPDPDLLAQAPDAIVAKIERVLGPLAKIKGRGGEWDLGRDLEDAIRTIVEVKATEVGSVGALRRQGSLLEQAGPSSRADTLADALLSMKPNDFRAAINRYADEAQRDVRGQGAMEFAKPEDPATAFRKAFEGQPPPLRRVAEAAAPYGSDLTTGLPEDRVHGIGVREVGNAEWPARWYYFPPSARTWKAEHLGTVALRDLPDRFMLGGDRDIAETVRQTFNIAPSESVVFRLGEGEREGLKGRNAANLEGIASFFTELADSDYVTSERGGGAQLSAYRVTATARGPYVAARPGVAEEEAPYAERGLPSGERPRAASASSESGMPSDQSRSQGPETQAEPSQRLTSAPPSGVGTSRTRTPSESTMAVSGTMGATSTPSVRQPATAVNDLRRLAVDHEAGVTSTIRAAIEGIPGAMFQDSRIKGLVEIEKKVVRKGYDADQVTDYLGARVTAATPAAIEQIAAALERRYRTAKREDRLEFPTPWGYRATHLDLRAPDGFVFEVQIVPTEIAAYQKAEGHTLYERWRDEDFTTLRPEARSQFNTERAKSNLGFQAAYDAWRGQGRVAEREAPYERPPLIPKATEAPPEDFDLPPVKPEEVGGRGLLEAAEQLGGRILGRVAEPLPAGQTDVVAGEPLFKGTSAKARKGATTADRENAQLALFDLDQTAKQAEPTVAGKIKPRGEEAGAGVRTVQRFVDAIKDKGYADYRGQPVESAQDLAVLGQTLRDPRYETFRVFYLKGNEVVSMEAMTSRLPGTAMFYEGTPAPGKEQRRTYEMRDRMRRLGADGYYLMHNHPSGRPEPSREDMRATEDIAGAVPGFRGHVVINSGQYGLIEVKPAGQMTMVATTLEARQAGRPVAVESVHELPGRGRTMVTEQHMKDDEYLSKIRHEINSPEQLAFFGKTLQVPENAIGLIYRDSAGYVRAVQEMPRGLFLKPKEAADFMRGQQRAFGARDVMAWFKPDAATLKQAKEYIATGNLTDAMAPGWTKAENLRANAGFLKTRETTGTMRGIRVQEEGAPYGEFERLPEETRKKLVDYGRTVLQGGKTDFASWAKAVRDKIGGGVSGSLPGAWSALMQETARTQAKRTGGKPPAPPKNLPTSAKPLDPPPGLTEPQLKLGVHKDVLAAAEDLFKAGKLVRDPKTLLSDQILEAIRDGKLRIEDMASTLDRHGMTFTEFGASMFRPAITDAAKRLGAIGQLQRRLNELESELKGEAAPRPGGKPGEPDPAKIKTIGDILDAARVLDPKGDRLRNRTMMAALSYWRRADNVRRGLLVTQLATSVRNFTSQVGRLGIDVMDQGLQGGLQRAFGKEVTQHPADGMRAMMEVFTRRPSEAKARVDAILEGLPREEERLFSNYASDLNRMARTQGAEKALDAGMRGAEKAVEVLNTFNRFQEYSVRRAVFQTELAARLRTRGIDLEAAIKDQAVRREIPVADIRAAIEKALEITFASNPAYGSSGYHFIRWINKTPGATFLIPFPRFMMNAMKFYLEFSPAGFLKFLSESERQKFRQGDMKTMSRAILGMGLLSTAYLIRSMQGDDTKWNEVRLPGMERTIDVRPLNPFASYLFVADILHRAANDRLYGGGLATEAVKNILGVNVRGGTGLQAIDQLVDGLRDIGDARALTKYLQGAGGHIVAGLLTPLQQLTDVYAEFDPEAQIVRNVREQPFSGPIKQRLPSTMVEALGGELAEEKASPTAEEPVRRESPGVRQLTGITMGKAKNDFEKELDRLQIPYREILPSQGDARLDNILAKHMGPLAEEVGSRIVNSARFQRLGDMGKRLELKDYLSRLRKKAKAKAMLDRDYRDIQREVKAGTSKERLAEMAREERSGLR